MHGSKQGTLDRKASVANLFFAQLDGVQYRSLEAGQLLSSRRSVCSRRLDLSKQVVEVSFLDLQCRECFGLAVFALANSPVSDRAILIVKNGQSDTGFRLVLLSTRVLSDSVAGTAMVPEGSFHDSPHLA